MARGTLVVVVLLVGMSALLGRSCQRMMAGIQERMIDLGRPGNSIWQPTNLTLAETDGARLTRLPAGVPSWKPPLL